MAERGVSRETRGSNEWGEERRTGLPHLPGGQACVGSPACMRSFQQGKRKNGGPGCGGGGRLARAVVQRQRDEPLLSRPPTPSDLLPLGQPLPRPLGALAPTARRGGPPSRAKLGVSGDTARGQGRGGDQTPRPAWGRALTPTPDSLRRGRSHTRGQCRALCAARISFLCERSFKSSRLGTSPCPARASGRPSQGHGAREGSETLAGRARERRVPAAKHLLCAQCSGGSQAGPRGHRGPRLVAGRKDSAARGRELRCGRDAGTATAFAPFTPTRRGPTEAGTAERVRIQPFVPEAPRGPGGRAGDSGAVPGDATRRATRGNNTHTAKVRRLGGWPQVTSVPHLQEGAGPCRGRNASRGGGSCLWGCSSWGRTRGLRRPAPPGLPGPATADSRGGSYSHRERPGLRDGGGGVQGGGNWPRAADPTGRRHSTESPRAAGDLLILVTPRPSIRPACGHFWGGGSVCRGNKRWGCGRMTAVSGCQRPEGAGR